MPSKGYDCFSVIFHPNITESNYKNASDTQRNALKINVILKERKVKKEH